MYHVNGIIITITSFLKYCPPAWYLYAPILPLIHSINHQATAMQPHTAKEQLSE